jgi:hypothetical protein
MSPESIRSFAVECLCLVKQVEDPEHRELLMAMGQTAAELANLADQFQKYADLKENLSTAPALSELVNSEHLSELIDSEGGVGSELVVSR